MKMDLHFTRKEYAERQKAARKAMVARDLDGLLIFRQESMYYLSGYASFGYCFFQCLYMGADGRMTLLTRMPDVITAGLVSMLDDIRPWHNLPDANPAIDLRAVLEEHGCRGKRLGIELDAYGLTGLLHSKVQAAMTGFCNLEDASDLVSRLRMIKSPAELAYCRKAGALADAALAEANRLSTPGAWEGDILAAMQGAVFKGDGDYSGNEFIINSGKRAIVGRYITGRRRLARKDQMTIEWAGVYRYYHAAMMRTVLTGKPTSKERDIHKVAVEAHRASAAQIKPGNSFGAVYDAHAKVIKRGGYVPMGATGYNLGATFPPTWMDGPMFWPGNDQEIEVGMVLFVHTIVRSKDDRLGQCPGQSYIVTDRGAESLSKMSMDLVANG
jgi:Xaa-Pro dipeptidase